MKNVRNNAVEEHLENQPDTVREICFELRSIARGELPEAHEFVFHNAVNYSPTKESWYRNRFCYIWAHKTHVNLGFFFAVDLPDPERLLEGTGIRMRHIKIRSIEEANNPALRNLIREAWENAPFSIAKLQAQRGKRKQMEKGVKA